MNNRSDMMACEDYDDDADGCAWSRREAARIKQIQIGKARPEYQRYMREVPHNRRNSSQPTTPDPRARVSKRQFDRALGDWRRRLHEFDAVPRGPPRHQAENEWSPNGQSSRNSWGGGQASLQDDADQYSPEGGRRTATRRARAIPVPPRERSGKFGPRKPVDSPISKEPQALPENQWSPPPALPLASQSDVTPAQSSQPGAVRISLADQLMEIPMQPAMPMQDWQLQGWYPGCEAAWGMIETPQKLNSMGMIDMPFMTMETPDKPMMPGHTMSQQFVYDENGMLKVDDSYLGMPVESCMLPHRLFDSSPEKCDPGAILDFGSSSSIEATASDNCDTLSSPERIAPESPRCRREKQDELGPLMSPQPGTPGLGLSAHYRGLATPTPATPKRACYVPETPSPDRMHLAWMHPTMPPFVQPTPLGGLPWHYGAQATDQVMPEFLHMMSSMTHEGQPST